MLVSNIQKVIRRSCWSFFIYVITLFPLSLGFIIFLVTKIIPVITSLREESSYTSYIQSYLKKDLTGLFLSSPQRAILK